MVDAENNNIYVGNRGVANESNAIRIGTPGSNTGCFVAGIRGVTTNNNNAMNVLIDSAGQLGTISSSKRYKKNIQNLPDQNQKMLQLRPVSFNFISDASNHTEYGLIAEEVNEVYPEIIVHDESGEIYSINYMALIPLLIKQIQSLELAQKNSQSQDLYEKLEKQEQQIIELKKLVDILIKTVESLAKH